MSKIKLHIFRSIGLILLFSALSLNAWEVNEAEREIALTIKPDKDRGLEIYVLCADCHRAEGWGSVDGLTPSVAGQHRNVLIKQLWDIRQGNRDNQSMYDFLQDPEVSGDQAISDVSAYIATLPMNPETHVPDDVDIEAGKELYQNHCSGCHQPNGEGIGDWLIPRIQGQHSEYLMRQLSWMKQGKRRNANTEMMRELDQLEERQLAEISAYVAGLIPDGHLLAPDAEWTNPDFN